MAAKSKKPRKTKKSDVVETEVVHPQISSPPVKKRLLPHNMAAEIALLQDRVSELEKKIESILSDK